MKIETKPPKELLEKIITRIHDEESFLVFRTNILFSIILVLSLIWLVPAFKMLLSDMNQTGFLKFLSLAVSDYSLVVMCWKSFSMILLETLPTISLGIFLFIVLAILQSFKLLVKNIKLIKNHVPVIN
jgi:hypothetical protein